MNIQSMNQFVVKNMVCPRCIESVREVFTDLGLTVMSVTLGNVVVDAQITMEQKEVLRRRLWERGFELLDDKRTQLINQIKAIVIREIHHQDTRAAVNLSTLLASELHYDYAHLSRLFSAVEGRTIEQFVIAQKVEKIKELLTYGELTLSEIAFQMQYSSAAHLSSQFKKVTGMSPSEFKKLQRQERHSLHEI